ncbi:MAG: polysaccharide export protein [Alphaproteobacteria bacterium]|nr:polysaccharide export protein [Alphaproteobacteria bacterium]
MRGFVFGTALVFACCGNAAADDGLRKSETETVVVTAPSMDYRLGAGDKIRVTVYNETDLSGEFQIDGTGYVRLPLVGQVKATGRTAHQLESDVGSALSEGYLKNPRVSIEVTAYRPFYIIGQVNRPGQYAYASNMSALDAIGMAGGFTEHAVESTVHIRHEGDDRTYDVKPDATAMIRPGDVVTVDQTLFWDFAQVLSPASSTASMAYVFRP